MKQDFREIAEEEMFSGVKSKNLKQNRKISKRLFN